MDNQTISMQRNAIGLEVGQSKDLAQKLNLLLADYSVFYINTRGYHWNLKGHKFFELHLKFEELYDDLHIKMDEIAERILTLGETPMHTYTEYVKESDIQETPNVKDGFQAVENILSSFRILLEKQRVILEMSGDAGDEGTNSMMSDYITEQEKLVWMYSAFMG